MLLLPDTPATTNILDADTLALLPRGAVVINPGRGALIDDAALLAWLNRTSDLLFVLARVIARRSGGEVVWRPRPKAAQTD